MSVNEVYRRHYIAVIGGSVSGSEAANLLAKSGFRVVVFDMNKLPYGKIEEGLPNWHINLRNRQITAIDKKLNHPNIRFVPCSKIGNDILFSDLVKNWGFSAIILANGAWQDRYLPISNIDKFIDKELIYQNALIKWFNHKHEPDFNGVKYLLKNDIIVIGGGLSSLDVVKVIMIEKVRHHLFSEKGIDIDLFTLEKKGVQKILDDYNITLKDINVKKAKLVYRRTAREMPLKSPNDTTAKSIEIAKNISERLLNKYQEKYLFEFIPLSTPVNFTEKDNKLTGIIFQKVSLNEGKITPIKHSCFEIKTSMVISSIGSVPEKIEGLQYEYSSLKMRDKADYHVFGYDNVFAVGNAVTDRGNILDSKLHGKQMTKIIIDKHLTEDAFEEWLVKRNKEITTRVDKQLNSIIDEISHLEIQPKYLIQNILDKTNKIHERLDYIDYMDWVTKNLPKRLEEIIKTNE